MILPYALIAEFAGSFLFFSVILSSSDPLPVVVALLAAIYFGGHLSGGNFNPAVTTMMMLRGDLSRSAGFMYIVAQVTAAVTAFQWARLTLRPKAVKQLA